jgi:hypothetical protein
MNIDEARQVAAQCWCKPETEHIEMMPELCEEFAKALIRVSGGYSPETPVEMSGNAQGIGLTTKQGNSFMAV